MCNWYTPSQTGIIFDVIDSESIDKRYGFIIICFSIIIIIIIVSGQNPHDLHFQLK